MKKDVERDIARRLRAAVQAQAPDGLDALLEAVEDRPVSARAEKGPRRARPWLLRPAAACACFAALAGLLAVSVSMGTPYAPPAAFQPNENEELLEAAGFVMKAYASPGSGEESPDEQVLTPNQTVTIQASASGMDIWPSAVSLENGMSEYRIRIPFDVVCQGDDLVSVDYRASQGRFEQKLSAGPDANAAEFAFQVERLNREAGGGLWGYASLGDHWTVAAGEQADRRGELYLTLTLTEAEDAPAYMLETAFRRMLALTDVLVTLTFADGSQGEALIRLGAGTLTGGVEATLVIVSEE